MEKYPVIWEGRPVGELTEEREALYTWFSVRCRLPEDGLWSAWAVGSRGELRLGVLEPETGIRRRFSRRLTDPLGPLLQGEVRPVWREEGWSPVPEPDRLFRTPWLRESLRGAQGVLTQPWEEGRALALPYDRRSPFPLTALFCFAQLRQLGGRSYLVFRFDGEEWPRFP